MTLIGHTPFFVLSSVLFQNVINCISSTYLRFHNIGYRSIFLILDTKELCLVKLIYLLLKLFCLFTEEKYSVTGATIKRTMRLKLLIHLSRKSIEIHIRMEDGE